MAAGIQDIQSKTLAGSFTGSAAAVYPGLALVNSLKWNFDVWLVSIQFSTTLTIYPANPLAITEVDCGGMIITLGKQPSSGISVGEGLNSVIEHITAPNSIASVTTPLANPSSKVSVIPFGGCGKFLRNGELVSLYAFAPAVVGNFLFSVSSIQYRRVE